MHFVVISMTFYFPVSNKSEGFVFSLGSNWHEDDFDVTGLGGISSD